MANATLTDPAVVSLSQPRETNPKASSRQVMPWEYDERRIEKDLAGIELDPDKAAPIPMASEGSMTGFNKPVNESPDLVPEMINVAAKRWAETSAQDTPIQVVNNVAGEAAVDFAKNAVTTAGSLAGDFLTETFNLFKYVGAGEGLENPSTLTTSSESESSVVKPTGPETVDLSTPKTSAQVEYTLAYHRKIIQDQKNLQIQKGEDVLKTAQRLGIDPDAMIDSLGRSSQDRAQGEVEPLKHGSSNPIEIAEKRSQLRNYDLQFESDQKRWTVNQVGEDNSQQELEADQQNMSFNLEDIEGTSSVSAGAAAAGKAG